MQTRASRRRAAQRAAELVLQRLSLLSLPAPAQHAVISELKLGDLHNLRLASKASASVVDETTRKLQLPSKHLCGRGVARLQQQFPSVTVLVVTGDYKSRSGGRYYCLTPSECEAAEGDGAAGFGSGDDGSCEGSGSDGDEQQDAADCNERRQQQPSTSLQPWHSITALDLLGVAFDEALDVLDACLSVRECRIAEAYSTRHGVCMAAVCGTLAALPSLTSLSLKDSHQRLCDKYLAALKGCTQLTALDARLGNGCGEAGMRTLLSMTSLVSLELEHRTLDVGVKLNFSALTALTHLVFVRTRGVHKGRFSDVYATLKLPPSLRGLGVSILPLKALAATPQLTLLVFDDPLEVSTKQLAQIAAACPVLASLTIPALHLTNKSHESPLTALTKLDCSGLVRVSTGGKLSAANGARLAKVFPAMRALHVPCDFREAEEGAGVALFAGVTGLETLEVRMIKRPEEWWLDLDDSDEPQYVPVDVAGFAALAALPHLAHLDLMATPEHVAGVAQLTALTSIEWLFDDITVSDNTHSEWLAERGEMVGWGPESSLRHTLATCAVPPRLRHASVNFAVREASGVMQHLYPRTIDAAFQWLGRAAELSEVTWSADVPGAAAETSSRLIELAAASDSMTRVTLRPYPVDSCDSFEKSWYSFTMAAVNKHQRPGLDIVFDMLVRH